MVFTDLADGFLARLLRCQTEFGKLDLVMQFCGWLDDLPYQWLVLAFAAVALLVRYLVIVVPL